MRTLFAVAIAGLALAAVSGTAHAAPIAPLPPSYTVDLGIYRTFLGAAGVTVGAVSAAGEVGSV